MEYIVVGLGNPGSEYKETKHNIGRMVVEGLHERWNISDWRDDKKLHAKVSQGVLADGTMVRLVLPDAYMNRSGASVAPLVKNKKQLEHLIVVHDDIDLALGTLRIVYNRGAGGHRGVESIERTLKSKAYNRVRVGVVPVSKTGKLKKPKDEEGVLSLILKTFTKKEREEMYSVIERAIIATEAIVQKGRADAICIFNTSTFLQKKKK